jgi:threonine dehydrogenase-like Zn-dependent dehydrogenase
VGLSCAALALLSGAGWVGVLGAPEQRLQAAKAIGADWTGDVFPDDTGRPRTWVRDATGGRGPDIVIEASGNPEAVREGVNCSRCRSGTSSLGSIRTMAMCRSTRTCISIGSIWKCADAGVGF